MRGRQQVLLFTSLHLCLAFYQVGSDHTIPKFFPKIIAKVGATAPLVASLILASQSVDVQDVF